MERILINCLKILEICLVFLLFSVNLLHESKLIIYGGNGSNDADPKCPNKNKVSLLIGMGSGEDIPDLSIKVNCLY